MVLIETHAFPDASIIAMINKGDQILLESCENYQKRSHRNRYYLVNDRGRFHLSIPLKKGKNEQMPIKDVKISYDENWTAKQLNTIKTAYHSAPFYLFINDFITELFAKKMDYLFDFNLQVLMWILSFLEIEQTIHETTEYHSYYENHQDHRLNKTCNPNLILPYTQVFEEQIGFTTDLSILDLLMCTGKEAKTYFN